MNGYDLVRLQSQQVKKTGDTMTGRLIANGGITGSLTGNADTSTKLQNPRNITIGNATRQFDGSGNITFTLADIGAGQGGGNYLPLTGGTVTGNTTFNKNLTVGGITNCKSINIDGDARVINGKLFSPNGLHGAGSTTLGRSVQGIPSAGGSVTTDFVRVGNLLIAGMDNGNCHFIKQDSTDTTVYFANQIALGRTLVYLPQAGGDVTTDYLRIGGGFMCGVDSGNFHFITKNATKATLYANNLVTTYSLSPMVLSENSKNVFDTINSVNVIDTKEGVQLVPNMNKSIDDELYKPIVMNYNEETNKEEIEVDLNSSIAILWKAVQELKKENEELKKSI